jgi:hypothetical protein
MKEVSDETVLGNFADQTLTHYGVTSAFYRDGERFMVRAEGADGQLADFEIKYVFGVHPLQQYLIEFPGGRLQALSLAWDARSEEEGGQRWFHLYTDEKIARDDELHWTRPSQNWNSMCAECHSTHLQKNYDAQSRSFSTTWSEIDVSCEACHGLGSNHVLWAEKKTGLGCVRIRSRHGGAIGRTQRRQLVNGLRNRQCSTQQASPERTRDRDVRALPCQAQPDILELRAW